MRNLTVIDSTLERAEMQTAPGMAHWAGSGPEGAKCGGCLHYGYSYIKSNGNATNRQRACEKFWKMTARHGGPLDESQIGCKYYEAKARA